MKISHYPSARKYQFFPSHPIWIDVSENGATDGNPTYDSDVNIFQHQVQLRSIFGGIVSKLIQDPVSAGSDEATHTNLTSPEAGQSFGSVSGIS